MKKWSFFCAISPRIIAKPSCSRVKRSRIIALGVAALQNGPASLQKAFTPMQNGLASSQGCFAALFHIRAMMRGKIAWLFGRRGGLWLVVAVGFRVARTIRDGHRVAAEVFEVFLHCDFYN